MTIQQAYQQLLILLYKFYDDREAANIADWVIENVTGFKKIDRILNKQFPLNTQQQQLLNKYADELAANKPVQYVLHEAWFAKMKFYVDENVLIPRPETEELVEWIIANCQSSTAGSQQILDIGTGSGCIPIALKKALSTSTIHAIDISEVALQVAKQNAKELNADVTFHLLDILNKEQWKHLNRFDIIVSNPPYIKQSEAETIKNNVLKYEPPAALFVSDEDPLLFYRTIAAFGLQHLNRGGQLYFEINETSGKEVCKLLEDQGYKNIELRKDMQGKNRMIKAPKP